MPLRLTTSRRLLPSFVCSSSSSSSSRINLRSSGANVISSARLFFSTTTRLTYPRGHQKTHYETLNVPVTATGAEIKKQFYALSLKHHPDRNRSDPGATERFANISSAYQILGDSAKRARYDRDHGIANHNTRSSAVAGQHPMGSYSSAGSHMRGSSYVGSRPASGLSKRRGSFKGPPPSFYAHGGYGVRGSRPGAGGTYTGTGSEGVGGGGGGTAPTEEDPASFIHNNPVWHFNAKGHFKTQAAEDARREQRRSRQKQRDQEIRDRALNSSGSLILRFIVVSSILVSVASLGTVLKRKSHSKQPSSRNRDR